MVLVTQVAASTSGSARTSRRSARSRSRTARSAAAASSPAGLGVYVEIRIRLDSSRPLGCWPPSPYQAPEISSEPMRGDADRDLEHHERPDARAPPDGAHQRSDLEPAHAHALPSVIVGRRRAAIQLGYNAEPMPTAIVVAKISTTASHDMRSGMSLSRTKRL